VTELGVTYLPFTFSSDAVYAYLPLALLGVPVSISNTFVYMHIHVDVCMFVYPLYVYSAMYTVMYTCIYIYRCAYVCVHVYSAVYMHIYLGVQGRTRRGGLRLVGLEGMCALRAGVMLWVQRLSLVTS
jgi:hypothetical protein